MLCPVVDPLVGCISDMKQLLASQQSELDGAYLQQQMNSATKQSEMDLLQHQMDSRQQIDSLTNQLHAGISVTASLTVPLSHCLVYCLSQTSKRPTGTVTAAVSCLLGCGLVVCLLTLPLTCVRAFDPCCCATPLTCARTQSQTIET